MACGLAVTTRSSCPQPRALDQVGDETSRDLFAHPSGATNRSSTSTALPAWRPVAKSTMTPSISASRTRPATIAPSLNSRNPGEQETFSVAVVRQRRRSEHLGDIMEVVKSSISDDDGTHFDSLAPPAHGAGAQHCPGVPLDGSSPSGAQGFGPPSRPGVERLEGVAEVSAEVGEVVGAAVRLNDE